MYWNLVFTQIIVALELLESVQWVLDHWIPFGTLLDVWFSSTYLRIPGTRVLALLVSRILLDCKFREHVEEIASSADFQVNFWVLLSVLGILVWIWVVNGPRGFQSSRNGRRFLVVFRGFDGFFRWFLTFVAFETGDWTTEKNENTFKIIDRSCIHVLNFVLDFQ